MTRRNRLSAVGTRMVTNGATNKAYRVTKVSVVQYQPLSVTSYSTSLDSCLLKIPITNVQEMFI